MPVPDACIWPRKTSQSPSFSMNVRFALSFWASLMPPAKNTGKRWPSSRSRIRPTAVWRKNTTTLPAPQFIFSSMNSAACLAIASPVARRMRALSPMEL